MLILIRSITLRQDKVSYSRTQNRASPKALSYVLQQDPLYSLILHRLQGLHRLEKYMNLEGFLEKSLKMKYALKSTGKLHNNLEKSLNSSIFCMN